MLFEDTVRGLQGGGFTTRVQSMELQASCSGRDEPTRMRICLVAQPPLQPAVRTGFLRQGVADGAPTSPSHHLSGESKVSSWAAVHDLTSTNRRVIIGMAHSLAILGESSFSSLSRSHSPDACGNVRHSSSDLCTSACLRSTRGRAEVASASLERAEAAVSRVDHY